MMPISSSQCRAARALIEMDQAALAAASNVSRNTIVAFEKAQRVPNPNNLNAIRAALEAAGVEFIAENGGGAGVRLRRRSGPSFAEFLASAAITDDPSGDFIKDARDDLRMQTVSDWTELRRYLWRKGAGHAVEAARVVWDAYAVKHGHLLALDDGDE